MISKEVGQVLYLQRRFDAAAAQYRKTLQANPNFLPANQALGFAYLAKGMTEEAEAEFRKCAPLWGVDAASTEAAAYAGTMVGHQEDARRFLEWLRDRASRPFIPPMDFMIAYLNLGETDQAFETLRRACDEQPGGMVLLKVDPMWDRLRGDPRFTALRRKVNLEKSPRRPRTFPCIRNAAWKPLGARTQVGLTLDTELPRHLLLPSPGVLR